MMARFGSVISVLSVAAVAIYLGNTFHSLYNLFHPEVCIPGKTQGKCIYPLVDRKTGKWPLHGLYIRVSPSSDVFGPDTVEVYQNKNFNLYKEIDIDVVLKLNEKLKKSINKLQLHAILLPSDQRDTNPALVDERLVQSSKLTLSKVPEASTFNLISDEKVEKKDDKKKLTKAPHIRSKIFLAAVEDPLIFPLSNLPSEILRFLRMERIDNKDQYYPIFTIDEMSSRLRDQIEIKSNNESLYFTVNYRPLSIGKLRMLISGQASFQQFQQLGFTEKDFDEVKGIYTDTNFYFLILTVFVSTIHLLLDFLSFKNDISFWKSRDSMVGLSTKTVIWRCISQTIIFFYLFDEKTSMLVLLPSGFGVLIELWKLTKALKVEWSFYTIIPLPKIGSNKSKEEQETDEIDSEAMRYLSILMIPLCIGGAIYSLLYIPHKSWYSWIINCLAKGVYAFGFLFMLPQLFLNYKLKSVAHLPWRAFMYKVV